MNFLLNGTAVQTDGWSICRRGVMHVLNGYSEMIFYVFEADVEASYRGVNLEGY